MKRFFFWLMVFMYIAAGINHLINPLWYLQIMPSWLPYHLPLIYISGVCELVLGILLIPGSTRRISAWLIIAMLVVYTPLHIQHILNYWGSNSIELWITLARFPIQFVLIWWAKRYTINNYHI